MAKRRFILAVLGLLLLLSLSGLITSLSPAEAASDEVRWSRVSIPTDGPPGNWALASGSSVRHLTAAADGTLYCYANPSATSRTLFKSIDGGGSWSYTGGVEDDIVDIVTAPHDASMVYYATTSDIYKSVDAGESFTALPANPGGAGSNNLEITAIDVAPLDGGTIIAVGTRDSDGSQYGGVYILDETQPSPSWADTGIGNYDVSGVAFSPNYATDRQLLAVATDETDTLVTTKISDADWGETIGDAIIAGVIPISAAIAFPDDYDAENGVLFVGIDTGSDNGDVFKVTGEWAPGSSVAADLNIGTAYGLSSVDVTSVAVSGNSTTANLLAGAGNSAQVYISTDAGITWARSTKEPTGESRTYVLMADDFASYGRAYTATSGTESAFSYTTDGGLTWNQLSLIDTKISDIIDLAVSPRYIADNTLFMLTFDGEHTERSLWRSPNGGTTWERVFASTLPNVDSIERVKLSPQYSSSSQVLFLAGTSNGNPAIWKSIDNGQVFTPQSAPLVVDTWAVVNGDTLFIGGYDGTNGLVYRSDDSGLSYSSGVEAGNQLLNSIALSPYYEQDGAIMVGNTTGQVYWSNDNGSSFALLGQQLPLSAGVGGVAVAFDPRFTSNKAVYAASDAEVTTDSKERIYRFIIGKSDTWESIDSTLPDSAMINQLTVSSSDTLYAVNLQSEGGMERSLNPTFPLNQTFETVTRGLDDDATLEGLWMYNNQLWSIDTKNTKLVTYTDSLSTPVILASPANKAPGIDTRNVNLEWAGPRGATEYKWQLDYETNFSSVPDGFEGNTSGNSIHLPALEPATTYYWRVRASQPVLSPWSTKQSFTTVLGGTVIAPELLSPKAGANPVPLKPVFQWSAIAGADSYELLVSTGISFANPVILRSGTNALATTAWQSDISLCYNTTYYWKVRASSSKSYSAWSAVGAFTTEAPPPESPPPPEPAPSPESSLPPEPPPTTEQPPPESSAPELPPPESSSPPERTQPELSPAEPSLPELTSAQLAIPNWAIYLVGGLLLIMVLLLATLLVLVVGIRRY